MCITNPEDMEENYFIMKGILPPHSNSGLTQAVEILPHVKKTSLSKHSNGWVGLKCKKMNDLVVQRTPASKN